MKKTVLFQTSLTTYSLLAASFLAGTKADAQIIYTDIDPDAFIDNDNSGVVLSEPIDLNNDGMIDFKIENNYCSFCYYYVIDVEALPAQVAVYNTFYNAAKALDYGDNISAALNKWEKTGIYVQFGNIGVWDGEGDHYLAVRLKEKGDFYYGWIRMEVSEDNSMFYVRDYAYNSVLNEPITAGQTTPCGDGFENNNSFTKAKEIRNGLAYHALIDTAGDVDFFKLSLQDPNVRITLTGLPKNFNLRLYDVNKQLISSSLNTGLKNDTIIYNNAPAADYYIKVLGKNNKFDPANCYTLKVETSTSPFRLSVDEIMPHPSENIFMYPNPASHTITLANVNGMVCSVKLLDGAGKLLKEWNPESEQENLILDINDMKAGCYLLQIATAEGWIVRKVVVSK